MFVVHRIIRSRSVRRVSSGIFVFLLWVFVGVCFMLLMADSSLDLLVVLVFSFFLEARAVSGRRAFSFTLTYA